LLLGLATIALSARARHLVFLAATAAAGALCGLLLPLPLDVDQLAMWIAFFAVWQGTYAAATAFSLRLAAESR